MPKLVIFLSFIAIASLTQAQQLDVKKLDSAFSGLNKIHRFNGTVLYAEKGKVLYSKAFGVTDCRTNEPLKTTSSFNLASVTKQFIGMGIMILKERGQLRFDDNCKKYIPELPYDGITIRNLMTHTSGIPEYFDLFQMYKTPLDTLTNEKLISLYGTYKPVLDFATGSKWNYCNTNYVLLVSIIERISKQPIDVFVKKNITGPLGLKDTYVYHVLMPAVPANHVYGFEETGEKKKLNDLTPFDGVVGDGNIYSSVEDLYRWEQSLSTGKLVKKETFAEALVPVKLKDGTTYPYGFGWFIEKDKEGAYSHTGGWVGFANLIYSDTKNKRTIIQLSSGSNGWGIRTARNFIQGKPLDIAQTTLIKNVVVMDGTAAPAKNESVRIQGKKIIAVGNLQPFEGEEIIDGEGKILSPGFIDSHSHVESSLKKYPEGIAALNQGITTIVGGQDGESDPVDSLKAEIKATPIAINLATYTGHATIRQQVMGAANLSRPAKPEELEKIKQILKGELQKGSLGLSTGLEYEEGFYSNRYEVIELAKTTAAEKGRYISHIRSEDINMTDAIDEIIQIGKEAKLPVQISHIKIALKDDWGTANKLLATLQRARADGVDITADCYPYDAWHSTMRVLFPKKDFTSLASATYATDHLFDADGSVLVHFAADTSYNGKTFGAIAKIRNETAAQTLLYLVGTAEAYQHQHLGESGEDIMGKSMADEDIRTLLAWPHTNLCSDGANGGHPRGYGSFTKLLNQYVKQQKIMSWEAAINKMTGLAAEHTGITNRGIIAPGYFADLVLIDPETVKDNATIQNSKALSDGIKKVWVNGVLVYTDKTFLNKYPGEFVGR
ncbi:serine hydrolase [Ferruginibacter paludis]|uniref:serine hydrolase n=1 Tax=Ferruginibacter paludis TaxID=1310417 RepID=UPI0025B31639|nr:serine hydrolase [Ferruginibacter paludis]MDN3656651.1 serine hydrolase [Ferruginibacter paludis]